ncbi:hypothetical protein AB5I41_08825 [Sphingomonas sp. MMS24-JH45]
MSLLAGGGVPMTPLVTAATPDAIAAEAAVFPVASRSRSCRPTSSTSPTSAAWR